VSLVRRFAALLAAVLVATYPLALERCRTACLENTPTPAAGSAHACHDVDDESGPSVSPAPQACGHTDAAKSGDIAGLAPSKARAELPISAAIVIAIAPIPARPETAAPPGGARRATFNTHRTLPLRL
jgi:hypothetical protein